MSVSHSRRQYVIATVGGLVAVTTRPAAACIEFLTTEHGPFYPQHSVVPERFDLTRVEPDAATATGDLIHVGGRVLDHDCNQLDDAWITIWQADRNGQYKHEFLDNADQLDQNFGYFGRALAIGGTYRFKTIRPAPYSFAGLNRARHIHFEISHPKLGRATTEMYFGGRKEDQRRRGDEVWLERDSRLRASLIRSPLDPTERSSGGIKFPDDDLPAYRFDLQIA